MMRDREAAARQLASRITELKAGYREQIAAWRAELETLAAKPAWTEEERSAVRDIAHRLSGGGGTFGFHALSRAGRETERRIIDGEEARAELTALIAACRAAETEGEG